MNNKILLVGGAGYIGTVLIKHLLDSKYQVTCLDNLIYNNSYSLSEFKSGFMDLYVPYISHFIIGTRSGASDVSLLFNTPLLVVNSTTFVESPVGKDNLFIQKKLMDLSGEIIPYKDIISDSRYYSLDGNRMENLYGIKYLNNSAEEILDATIEMHNILNGNLALNKNQRELLKRYQNEYCQKNNWSNRLAPISINWLEKNYHLYLEGDIDLIGDRNIEYQ